MGRLTDWLIVDPDLPGRLRAQAHHGPVETWPVHHSLLSDPTHPRLEFLCSWCRSDLSDCWCPPGGPDGGADR